MRLSDRPERPPEPPSYRTQVFDPLGFVAGMCEELGLTAVIEHATPQAPGMRLVTVGPAVKALVLHCLGFVNPQRSLVPHCFPP
jgi:Domain of unknown function (DUF4277)